MNRLGVAGLFSKSMDLLKLIAALESLGSGTGLAHLTSEKSERGQDRLMRSRFCAGTEPRGGMAASSHSAVMLCLETRIIEPAITPGQYLRPCCRQVFRQSRGND
jgi:hypothetical protein